MNCLFGTPLAEEQLLATVDGDSHIETVQHLEQCPYCTERLWDLQKFEQRLITRSHPDSRTLLDYGFGLLSQTEMVTILEHLKYCAECQEIVGDFELSIQETVQPQLNLQLPLSQRSRQVLKSGEVLRELIAQIIPHTGTAFATLGSVEPALVAVAGSVKVFLHRESIGDKLSLDGQVVGDEEVNWAGGVVLLTLDHKEQFISFSTLLNDLGQFNFGSLTSGVYKLRIELLSGTALTLYELALTSS